GFIFRIQSLREIKEITMRVLFIGGTGNISQSVSQLVVERGIELYLLNRGHQAVSIPGATQIKAGITQVAAGQTAIGEQHFDVVVNWIAYHEADIERDLALFGAHCSQYIFISSASAYQKPPTYPIITESTPLANPYWRYSQEKIRCEARLMRAYLE